MSIYHQDENFKKEIKDLYIDEWSVLFVLELVQHPENYRDKMEAVIEQIKQEFPLFTARPSVDKHDFEFCPKRMAIIASTLAENNLKKVR